jgi:hypothetical protein
MGAKKIASWSYIIVLSFVAALRGNTYDTIIYRELYDAIGTDISPAESWGFYFIEPVFSYLIYCIKYFFNFSVELFFFSLTLTSLYFFIKCSDYFCSDKYRNWSLSLFAVSYFPLLFFIQIRQGLALTMGMYAAILIFEKRSISLKIVLLMVLSSLIHYTVLIFWIIVFFVLFANKHLKTKTQLLVALLICCGALSFLSSYLYLLGLQKLDFYLDNDLYNGDANLLSLTHLKAYALFIVGFIYYKKINKKFDLLLILYSVSILIRVSMRSIEVFSSRGASLFAIFDTFLIICLLNIVIKDYYIKAWLMVFGCCLQGYLLFFVVHKHLIELY